MSTRIAFFDTKPYDKEFFEEINKNTTMQNINDFLEGRELINEVKV